MAQLVIPNGTDYDLAIYCDNCTSAADTSTQSGNTMEQVYVRWEEGCIAGFPDGGDDDRDVYIVVTFKSGNICDDYELTITGHTDLGGTNCSEP